MTTLDESARHESRAAPPEEEKKVKTAIGAARAQHQRQEML